jgi:hypothetical protein
VSIKTDVAPKGNSRTPPVILGSGELIPVAVGIMEGSADFQVRGTIRFRMERRPHDRHGGQCAKLFCLTPTPSECDMALIETSIDDGGHDYWHSFLCVEGYLHRVRAVRDGKRMVVTFFDTAQPVPFTEEEKRLIGAAA